MSRLHIVHVVESLEPWGTQRALVMVACNLNGVEFEQSVVCARSGPLVEEFRAAGVQVQAVGRSVEPSPAAAWRALQAVYRRNPAVVHLWDEWARRNVGPALTLRRKLPLVCSLHNPPRALDWGRRAVDRLILKRAAVVIAEEELVLHQTGIALGCEEYLRVKGRVFDGAIAERFISLAAADSETLCRNWNLPPRTQLIGTASQVTQAKNWRDFIFAGALLRLARDDFRLVLCGTGPGLEAARRFNTLMRMDDLTIFTGTLLDIERYLPQFDVYVDAAAHDGPAHGIAEAQACGIPVVCVDSPLRRRQVRPDVDALLFPENDPGTLTRHLYQLLGDDDLRRRFGAAAQAAAASRPTSATVAAEYTACYRIAARAFS